jgi:hypothetical protein
MIYDYIHRHEFRLACLNSKARDEMFDAMIKEEGIHGGWFYWYCFPGCMPDGDMYGPFPTYEEALADAQVNDVT